jgi:diguanylate cyclase (GGDEF)-like protein
LRSLRTNTAYPALSPEDDHATDPALAGLDRLRQLLGVETAVITRHLPDGARLVAASGKTHNLAEIAAWQDQAMAAQAPLVLANTAASAVRFFAGIPLAPGNDSTPLLLSLADRRPRSLALAHQLAALAIDVTSRATIARLAAKVAQNDARSDYLRRQFDRASATAMIGIWECNLADESLSWTNGVYDLFEFPRGSAISREQTLACYTPESRIAMQAARAEAIASCTDFSLVAEIITTTGKRRWMRLTGAVEADNGVAVRIFGMKQDITEEKLLSDRTRYLAEFDVMTGLANRGRFQNRLDDLDGIRHGGAIAGLLLVDLDGFKQVNDTYGHALGDECLKEAAMRLTECCGNVDLVARIGGDEFAVLVGNGLTPSDIRALGDVIVHTMRRPLVRSGQHIALAASVGVALRADGTSDDLFRQADLALYQAKAAGRNTSRLFEAAQAN